MGFRGPRELFAAQVERIVTPRAGNWPAALAG